MWFRFIFTSRIRIIILKNQNRYPDRSHCLYLQLFLYKPRSVLCSLCLTQVKLFGDRPKIKVLFFRSMLGKSHHEPPEQLLDSTAAAVPSRTAVVPSRGAALHRTAAGRTVASRAAPKEAVRRRQKEPAASLAAKSTGNLETCALVQI
jgi:hypothetical protein